MGKNIKGVVPFDSSTHGANGKMNLKHQNLLQDYQELEKETDSMKTRLEIVKQRKRFLLAEVSFLRKRFKYLTAIKSANQLKEQELVARVSSSASQKKLSSQNRIPKEKVARLHHLPPLPSSNHRGIVHSRKGGFHGDTVTTLDLNHRQMVCLGKEVPHHNNYPLSDSNGKRRVNNVLKRSPISHVSPVIDLNLGKEAHQYKKEPTTNKRKLNGSKKAAVSTIGPVIDLNLTDRMHIGNDVAFPNTTLVLDLNQDSSLSGREASFSSRAPIFDLNEVSIAEEDIQNNSAPLEDLKISLMRSGNDDQFNHELFSGEGSSRVGKRKITWQDPVALRV